VSWPSGTKDVLENIQAESYSLDSGGPGHGEERAIPLTAQPTEPTTRGQTRLSQGAVLRRVDSPVCPRIVRARIVQASLATLILAVACFAQPTANPYQEGIRLLRNQKLACRRNRARAAVELQPRSVDAHIAARNRAASDQRHSIRLAVLPARRPMNPSSAEAHYNLGLACASLARPRPRSPSLRPP